MWGRKASVSTCIARINYYVKRGYLYRIRRGFYAMGKEYDRFEFATKLYTPAYISFESVLRQAGIIFQYYSQVFVASYKSTAIEIDGQLYIFKAIKGTILTNSKGVENRERYSIASPERAFLDTLYLHTDYYFDNLRPLDWAKVYDILPIYGGNKRMAKKVEMYHKSVENNERDSNDA